MKRTASYIIGGLVIASIVGALIGFRSMDFNKAKHEQLQAASDAMRLARRFSCQQIGELTSQCYATHGEACNDLHSAEDEHLHFFKVEAYQDCVVIPKPGTKLASGEIVEEKTGIPTQIGDELFFGDEAGK